MLVGLAPVLREQPPLLLLQVVFILLLFLLLASVLCPLLSLVSLDLNLV